MKLRTYMKAVRKQIVDNSKAKTKDSVAFFACIISARVSYSLAAKTKNSKLVKEYFNLHLAFKERVKDWIFPYESAMSAYRSKTGVGYTDETYTEIAYQARIYMLDELISKE
jgi:hypothetical protein